MLESHTTSTNLEMKQTFWTRLDTFPPVLCRMLARHKKGLAKTSVDIALDGRIPLREVEILSKSTTWDGTPINILRGYLIGCELDFCNPKQMRRLHEYLRNPKWYHLKQHPQYKTVFVPILKVYQDYLKANDSEKKA